MGNRAILGFNMVIRGTIAVPGGGAWLPSQEASLQHWWHSSHGITTVSGDVSSWVDRISSEDATQITTSARPTYTAADADFGGKPSLAFDVTDDNLDAGGTSTLVNFLHNGTGSTIVVVCKDENDGVVNTILDSVNLGAVRTGVSFYRSGGSNQLEIRVGNGSGTWLVADNSGANSWTANAVVYGVFRLDTSLSTDYDLRLDGSQVASGNVTGTPSGGNASHDLSMGARASSNADRFGGCIAEVMLFDSYLSDATVTNNLEPYIRSEWGL